MTHRFHALRVAEVQPLTDDAVSVALTVPPPLRSAFAFEPGQHLTLRAMVQGEDVRRSYSVCSIPEDDELRVAIRHVPGGRFSTFANQQLEAGQVLAVLPPAGRFTVPPEPAAARHHVAFAAGSGITPVLSLLRSLLVHEPHSRFTLLYGNRTMASTMFRDALADLKDQHMARLAIHHVLSRQQRSTALLDGRLDAACVQRVLHTVLPARQIDMAWICGPDSMIDTTLAELLSAGVPEAAIRFERFGAPGALPTPRSPAPERSAAAFTADITLDGVRSTVHGRPGETVLDAALRAGQELPFACRGGVCATCRARVVKGSVSMAVNHALAPWEVEAGYALSCQAQPETSHVEVDFDQT